MPEGPIRDAIPPIVQDLIWVATAALTLFTIVYIVSNR